MKVYMKMEALSKVVLGAHQLLFHWKAEKKPIPSFATYLELGNGMFGIKNMLEGESLWQHTYKLKYLMLESPVRLTRFSWFTLLII